RYLAAHGAAAPYPRSLLVVGQIRPERSSRRRRAGLAGTRILPGAPGGIPYASAAATWPHPASLNPSLPRANQTSGRCEAGEGLPWRLRPPRPPFFASFPPRVPPAISSRRCRRYTTSDVRVLLRSQNHDSDH